MLINTESIDLLFSPKFRLEQDMKGKPDPFRPNFRLEQDFKGKLKQNHYLSSSEQNLDLNKT